jgi:hypothetical protein
VRHHRLIDALFPRALLVAAFCIALTGAVPPRPAAAQTTEALLDTLQHTGVLYFWNEANPANGLVKDRSTPGSVSSIASTGFGLSAIAIGVDRGWLDRDAARQRTLTTLRTFWNGPQGSAANGMIGYKGLYYHWLDMNTAVRTWDSELSTIDTALLFAGILDAKHYWTLPTTDESEIRALADSITWRADWNFARNNNSGIQMGWKPGTGFGGFGTWLGYNESMIMYLLALGNPVPSHAVPTNAWNTWVSGYDWETHYGYSFVVCPPLFTHQYSHCWVDFRGIQDPYMVFRGITYFENSRRATLAQHAYCVANPGGWVAYSDSLWGITASDDFINGYLAHGAPPAQNENGTLAPTAGISSLPFTPEISLPLIRNLWNNWRGSLWGPYGYMVAFNPGFGWVGTDYLGIDQGPIVLMIENYRTGAVWNRMMSDGQIQTGLTRANFVPQASTGVGSLPGVTGVALRGVDPNPARAQATIRFHLGTAGFARLDVVDARGRRVLSPVAGEQAAGEHAIAVSTDGLSPGLYWVKLATPAGTATTRFTRVR